MRLVGIYILFLPHYLVALKGNEYGTHCESKIDLLWEDDSLHGSRWAVETFSGCRTVPPLPTSDNDDKFYRVRLDGSVFGVAILRSSVFTARPGDRFSFSYFVSSMPSRPMTNLQLSFVTLDKKETLLIDTRSIPQEKVMEGWQIVSGLVIPVEHPTELFLQFYGFCGDSDKDVVAIDGITLESNDNDPSSTITRIEQPSPTNNGPETTTVLALTSCLSEALLASSSVCTSSSGSASMSYERSSSTALMISSWTSTPTTTKSGSKCPNGEDYDPCSCDGSSPRVTNILCDRIVFDQVMDVFNRTTPTNITVLRLKIVEDTIPANLTSESRVEQLWIECVDVEQLLQIDVDALSSSRNYMTFLKIINCGLAQLDFTFLNGSSKLTELLTYGCLGFFSSWSTLPSSSFLQSVYLQGITEDEEEINGFPQFPRLTFISMDNCSFNELFVGSILDAFAATANFTVQTVTIANSASLTSVPSQIYLFTRLTAVVLDENKHLRFLGPYALNSSSAANFYLRHCHLTSIDPDAFAGATATNGFTVVSLEYNQLTRLEYESFWPILQRLRSDGHLLVTENPFDCTKDPCHLAWIIRDHRELLDDKLVNARCDNGTKLSHLDPTFFNQCPS